MSPTSTTIACPVLASLLAHGGLALHPDRDALLSAARSARVDRADARRLELVDVLAREWLPEMWDITGRHAAADRLRRLPVISSRAQLTWRGEIHERVQREANVARRRAGRNWAAPSVDQHRTAQATMRVLRPLVDPDRYPEGELGPGPDVRIAATARAWLSTMWPIYTGRRDGRYEACPPWMLEPSAIVDEDGSVRSTITPSIETTRALRAVRRSHELADRRGTVRDRARTTVGELVMRLADL